MRRAMVLAFMAGCAAFPACVERPAEPQLLRETQFAGEIRAFRAPVVVTDRSVDLIDADGALVGSRELPRRTHVEVSGDGTRLGVKRMIAEEGTERAHFELTDEIGLFLWYTDALDSPVFHVSQAGGGTAVALACFESECGNKIIFYDRKHPDGRTIAPPVGRKAQAIGSGMSGDGGFLAVVFRTFDEPKTDGSSDLAYFDSTGRILWIKHYENERIDGRTTVSPQGTYVAAVSRNAATASSFLQVFGKNGAQVMEYPLAREGDYVMRFDDRETVLAVGSSRGKLVVLNLAKKSPVWEYAAGDPQAGFIDIDASSGYVAVSVTRREKSTPAGRPRSFCVFDDRGSLVAAKTFLDHGFGAWNSGPRVVLRDGGRKLWVVMPRRLLVFGISG